VLFSNYFVIQIKSDKLIIIIEGTIGSEL